MCFHSVTIWGQNLTTHCVPSVHLLACRSNNKRRCCWCRTTFFFSEFEESPPFSVDEAVPTLLFVQSSSEPPVTPAPSFSDFFSHSGVFAAFRLCGARSFAIFEGSTSF